jgi:fructan beta-fructosidase
MPSRDLLQFRGALVALAYVLPLALSGQSPSQRVAPAAPDEPHRPRFHVTPPRGWMNDPNGMVYLDGEYHLFYQHYPDSTVWGPMHWGHAISRDLVRWQHLPIALYPDSLGLIFSGSAVVDSQNTSGFGVNGVAPLVAIYTYHDMARERAGDTLVQRQGIAYSTDKGRTWTKYAGNPVLDTPGLKDFRDPKVFWHEQTARWIMVLAAGDHVQFHASPDLRRWTRVGAFGREWGAHGGVWECPDLFPMRVDGTTASRWVLLVSMNPGGPNGGSATQYFVGEFDGARFVLDTTMRDSTHAAGRDPARGVWLDHGRDNYAGVTWSNIPREDGRRLFIGWMSNWDYANVVPTGTWRSAMTVPRELTLHRTKDGRYRVYSAPVRELRTLRDEGTVLRRERLLGERVVAFRGDASPAAAEVDLEFVVPRDATSVVTIELSNDAGDRYRVGYDAAARQFISDRTQTPHTFSPKFASAVHTAPQVATDSVVRLHLLLDRASVELFADGGATTLTDIVFPSGDFTTMKLVVTGAPVRVTSGVVFGVGRGR